MENLQRVQLANRGRLLLQTPLTTTNIENLQRVQLANRGRLLLQTPGPVPFRICICSYVETIFSWTCFVSGLWISNILLFCFASKHEALHVRFVIVEGVWLGSRTLIFVFVAFKDILWRYMCTSSSFACKRPWFSCTLSRDTRIIDCRRSRPHSKPRSLFLKIKGATRDTCSLNISRFQIPHATRVLCCACFVSATVQWL